MKAENLPWILIVDDDEKNLHSTKRTLEDLKINIHTAISGEEALKAIVNKEFFLILMDVQMPGMDGFETTALIRGNKNYENIPIIFLTAISKEDKYVDAGYGEGAVDYLFKPVNPHTLVCKVKVFLELYLNRKELERKNQELRMYDHMVAHDLKAPLRGISNFVEFIKRDLEGKLEGKTLEFFNMVIKSTQRANELIESVLAFSEANKTDSLKETVEIRKCIDNAILNLKVMIAEKNASLTIENLPRSIECIPIKIQQLFQNLISNAIKYQIPENRPEIKIYGHINNAENTQGIIIEDNGIGFPQNKADDIFSPFKRLHGNGEYEGSGIGLATCKRIIDFHGWKIRAESEEGKGARFIILYPLTNPSSNGEPAPF